MKKTTAIFASLILLICGSGAAQKSIWPRLYEMITKPEGTTQVKITTENQAREYFKGPDTYVLLIDAEKSGKPLKIIEIIKYDPKFNNVDIKDPSVIFRRMQKQRDKNGSLSGFFYLTIESKKGRTKVEHEVEGRLAVTGEDDFNYTFAYNPKVWVNGKLAGDPEKYSFTGGQKKGSRLLLWPLNLAYYLPYEDLAAFYDWNIYKREGDRLSMIGALRRHDLWLPQFLELIFDEKRRVPLKIEAYVHNKEYVSAEISLEYDNKGLPVRQRMERELPSGEKEISVLRLDEVRVEKRKRGFFF